MIGGRPATAATTRKKRRRVGRRPSERKKSAVPARATSVSSSIVHADADRLCQDTQLGSSHQRRTARLVEVFDLAIVALKALRRDDFARWLDRSHGTPA